MSRPGHVATVPRLVVERLVQVGPEPLGVNVQPWRDFGELPAGRRERGGRRSHLSNGGGHDRRVLGGQRRTTAGAVAGGTRLQHLHQAELLPAAPAPGPDVHG